MILKKYFENIIFTIFQILFSKRKNHKSILTEKHFSITEGTQKQINVLSKAKLIWKSDNVNVATVDNTGMVRSIKFQFWKSHKFYQLYDVIIHNDKLYECIQNGYSGSTEPNWEKNNNSIVQINGKNYSCIKSHVSSSLNKPIQGKHWKKFWKITFHKHIWATVWRMNSKYSKFNAIEDGNNLCWIPRFKTVDIKVSIENSNYYDICNITIVPWLVDNSAIEIVSLSSFISENAFKKKKWNIFYFENNNNYNKILYKLIERMFTSCRLRFLAAEYKNGQTYFYAAGSTKVANNKLYFIKNEITNKPILCHVFENKPEKMLITPFGYFILIAQSEDKKDVRKIYKSTDLKEWKLEYNLRRRNNYILWSGWSFDFDKKTGIGNIYINEKYNLFPTKSAIITKSTYKVNGDSSIQVKENGNLLEKGKTSWHIAYEFPLVSDKVSILMPNNETAYYSCIKSHFSDKNNKPGFGKYWTEFWEKSNNSKKKWLNNNLYLSISERNKIRHLHNIQKDPFSRNIWLSTGDENSESNIFYQENQFSPEQNTQIAKLKKIGGNAQDWRTVDFVFTKNYIYWGMDAQVEKQKIFRIKRNFNETYDLSSVESYPKEELGIFADKPFFSSIKIVDNDHNIILFSTGNEISKYNIDNKARIFAVKESKNGQNIVKEIISVPAKIGSFGRLVPFFQDPKGYVYFLFYNVNIYPQNQILKTKIKIADNN